MNIDESKEMKKIAAKVRKELLQVKRDDLIAYFNNLAINYVWVRRTIELGRINKLITNYGTRKIQCTKSHGVQTLRIFRSSLFDEVTVNAILSKYPIHQVADVIGSGCCFGDNVQMAFQYNR